LIPGQSICREIMGKYPSGTLCSLQLSNDRMTKSAQYYLTAFLFLIIICRGIFPELVQAATLYSTIIQQNPSDKLLLLNGRIWHNQYAKVQGDQYFLSNIFLKGAVTFNGRQFNNLDLKYDILNDELILRIENQPIIIMNKEMADSFDLVFLDRTYHIINAGTDTLSLLRGYVNVLYDGPSVLYVKYSKKILPLAVDGKFDLFSQEHRIYLKKGPEIFPVSGKRELLILLEDKKKEVREYLKSSRFKVKRNDPDTFIPLLEYYDSIRK
jgi:hypothetical protein